MVEQLLARLGLASSLGSNGPVRRRPLTTDEPGDPDFEDPCDSVDCCTLRNELYGVATEYAILESKAMAAQARLYNCRNKVSRGIFIHYPHCVALEFQLDVALRALGDQYAKMLELAAMYLACECDKAAC